MFSQSDNYSVYISGAKFLLGKTKIDPTITDIVARILPKALNKDVNGAVKEFASIIYEKKKIKVLNPEFTKYTTNKITHLAKIFPQNDYFEITMAITDIVLVTDNYINKNIVPNETSSNTVLGTNTNLSQNKNTTQKVAEMQTRAKMDSLYNATSQKDSKPTMDSIVSVCP